MQQDQLQHESFINSSFPSSLPGRVARTLVFGKTWGGPHSKGCCHFWSSTHRGLFSVDNLFKSPDFGRRGIELRWRNSYGNTPYVCGAKERSEGGSCRIPAAAQEKHLNAKTRLKDRPQGCNSFNDFEENQSVFFSEKQILQTSKSLGHKVQIETSLLRSSVLSQRVKETPAPGSWLLLLWVHIQHWPLSTQPASPHRHPERNDLHIIEGHPPIK